MCSSENLATFYTKQLINHQEWQLTGVECGLLWPVHIETACCSVEFGAASSPRYDVERFGIIEAFGSLRQCDLVVVQGTITRKMAPRLRLVYDQMPEPKYVIAMGACAITGGLYFDSYNVLPGIDGILPVDVYVPGCPPRPETLIQGCMLLQEKIKRMKARQVKNYEYN